jgi:hypothetical protein
LGVGRSIYIFTTYNGVYNIYNGVYNLATGH